MADHVTRTELLDAIDTMIREGTAVINRQYGLIERMLAHQERLTDRIERLELEVQHRREPRSERL